MIEQKTAEQIEELLLDEMDNQDAGHVYNYEIAPALDHNGAYWMRIIKLDEKHYSFSAQSNAHQDDPAIGSLSQVAEWIVECIELALEQEQAELT